MLMVSLKNLFYTFMIMHSVWDALVKDICTSKSETRYQSLVTNHSHIIPATNCMLLICTKAAISINVLEFSAVQLRKPITGYPTDICRSPVTDMRVWGHKWLSIYLWKKRFSTGITNDNVRKINEKNDNWSIMRMIAGIWISKWMTFA